MKKLIFSTLLAVGLIGSVSASTWYVSTNGVELNIGSSNSPFASIQHAINQSTNGDVIITGPGRFTGTGNNTLNFNGKVITLKSQSGPLSTIIDLNGKGLM